MMLERCSTLRPTCQSIQGADRLTQTLAAELEELTRRRTQLAGPCRGRRISHRQQLAISLRVQRRSILPPDTSTTVSGTISALPASKAQRDRTAGSTTN
jgi:hypothetical protein